MSEISELKKQFKTYDEIAKQLNISTRQLLRIRKGEYGKRAKKSIAAIEKAKVLLRKHQQTTVGIRPGKRVWKTTDAIRQIEAEKLNTFIVTSEGFINENQAFEAYRTVLRDKVLDKRLINAIAMSPHIIQDRLSVDIEIVNAKTGERVATLNCIGMLMEGVNRVIEEINYVTITSPTEYNMKINNIERVIKNQGLGLSVRGQWMGGKGNVKVKVGKKVIKFA